MTTTASSYSPLDPKEEEELHKFRLLNVEERPFKRITSRMHTLLALASSKARQAPTPPPEHLDATNADDGPPPTDHNATAAVPTTRPPPHSSVAHSPPLSASGGAADQAPDTAISQLKRDIILDFAAFANHLVRLQLLASANIRQRAHYASERSRVLSTCGLVRDRNAALRADLDAARVALAQRRRFDELADRITANRALRPRDEQRAVLQRLRDEMTDLEAEMEGIRATWRERGEQFARIMDESMRLRRQIRDEKEEVERREDMECDEAGGAAASGAAKSGHEENPTPHLSSGNRTPAAQQIRSGGNATPAGNSPALSAVGGEADSLLKPRPTTMTGTAPTALQNDASQTSSRPASRAESRPISRRESPRGRSLSGSPRANHSSSRGASRLGSRRESPSTRPMDVDMRGGEGEDVEMGECNNKNEYANQTDHDIHPISVLTAVSAGDPPRTAVGETQEDIMDTT